MAKAQEKGADQAGAAPGDPAVTPAAPSADVQKQLAELQGQLQQARDLAESKNGELRAANERADKNAVAVAAAHSELDKKAEVAELKAAAPETAEDGLFLKPFDVKLARKCGNLEAGMLLCQVRLRKGVSANFAVDAIRSGICQPLP